MHSRRVRLCPACLICRFRMTGGGLGPRGRSRACVAGSQFAAQGPCTVRGFAFRSDASLVSLGPYNPTLFLFLILFASHISPLFNHNGFTRSQRPVRPSEGPDRHRMSRFPTHRPIISPPFACSTIFYGATPAHTQDFKSATTGVAAKTMRNELNNMVNGVTDPEKKKVRHPQLAHISNVLAHPRSLKQRCSPSSSSSTVSSPSVPRVRSCKCFPLLL